MGFAELLKLIMDYIERWWPVTIINQYEQAVLLRKGKFRRVLNPGWHFLPLKMVLLDRVISEVVVTTTLNIPPQSLVTKDDQQVVISTIVKYEIEDIEKYVLKVCDQVDALRDVTQGINKHAIIKKTYDEIRANLRTIDTEITNLVKEEAKEFGIRIKRVTLSDFGKIRSIRLFNEQTISN